LMAVDFAIIGSLVRSGGFRARTRDRFSLMASVRRSRPTGRITGSP
jgi:hypothetical protein